MTATEWCLILFVVSLAANIWQLIVNERLYNALGQARAQSLAYKERWEKTAQRAREGLS